MQKVIIGVGVVILVLVGVAAVFLMNINSAVKHGIEVAGPEILGTGVTVDSVDISFLSGSGSIKGLTVMNPEGYKDAAAISIGDWQRCSGVLPSLSTTFGFAPLLRRASISSSDPTVRRGVSPA